MFCSGAFRRVGGNAHARTTPAAPARPARGSMLIGCSCSGRPIENIASSLLGIDFILLCFAVQNHRRHFGRRRRRRAAALDGCGDQLAEHRQEVGRLRLLRRTVPGLPALGVAGVEGCTGRFVGCHVLFTLRWARSSLSRCSRRSDARRSSVCHCSTTWPSAFARFAASCQRCRSASRSDCARFTTACCWLNGVGQPRQKRLIVAQIRRADAAARALRKLLLVVAAIALAAPAASSRLRRPCFSTVASAHRQPTLGVVVQVLHRLHTLGAGHAAPPMTAPSSTRLRL